jgi:hypothetical protein
VIISRQTAYTFAPLSTISHCSTFIAIFMDPTGFLGFERSKEIIILLAVKIYGRGMRC